ncbi:MAG: NADH-dependent [FeFe] hydrogenase, group A6 [Bacilli bacterium]|jgi:NADP-reducing hydrogenase subunit HndD
MEMITVKFDGQEYQVPRFASILDAARSVGFDIPTLCHYKDLVETGACRVCLVEVKGMRALTTACTTPVHEGMEVNLHSPRVLRARRHSVELILSNHVNDCLHCTANGRCELQKVAEKCGIREIPFEGKMTTPSIDRLSPSIRRNSSKCILCGRCIEACKKSQGIGIVDFIHRGFETVIGPAENRSLTQVPCIYCGQCVNVCPTGALYVHEEVHRIQKAQVDGKHVIVQVAPAVRASLGEEFDLPIGTRVTGKMCSALKRLGFERVYDTNFTADLTVMEEGTELLERLKKHLQGEPVALPMVTSCSPGWVNYAEYNYHDELDHLSTCKSPQQMMGALVKSYYAEKQGLRPEDIFMVAAMPCTAKKYEKTRPEMLHETYADVDAVITTRELGDYIKSCGIDFQSLPEGEFDMDLLGDFSGAGALFGVTGGVTEAALRTIYALTQGREYGKVVFESIRGLKGIKEATIPLKNLIIDGKRSGIDLNLKIAIASSIKNAKILMNQVREGTSPYHFIEIMGCPGGCINGGGQSFIKPGLLSFQEKITMNDLLLKRAQAIYDEDASRPIRSAHLNPLIQNLYQDYLGAPNSELAHKILHTHYQARVPFPRLED